MFQDDECFVLSMFRDNKCCSLEATQEADEGWPFRGRSDDVGKMEMDFAQEQEKIAGRYSKDCD
jgi:hypothetical protein